NTIRRVDWQNVFPVVLLPRAYKFALGFQVLFLAWLGLVLTLPFLPWYGPAEDNAIFVERKHDPLLTADGKLEFRPTTKMLGLPWLSPVVTFDKKQSPMMAVPQPQEFSHPWVLLTAAGYAVFAHTTLTSLGWFAVMLLLWAWFGGMITRIVALRFAQDRRESFSQLVGFVRAKWLSYIGAMILPMIGIFLALLPVWLLGWIWQTLLPSSWIADGVLLILAFPFALAAVLMTMGMMCGWPLMFAAVSAEGSDAFDAVSRGFSYVYQRPMQFVFYHLCNLAVYVVGIIIAYFVFHQTVALIGYDPAGLMILFNSFAFAYFWSSSTVIYFLLRRSCDATPIDQVYLGDVKKRTLPPFGVGKNGEPELKEG
ncbi:MAG: hypothetical protein FWD31_15770, partial [Planctomycetaceae bacterium]|nr:hypothetical protein [Planctomycetaceae bacterium]